MPSPPKKRRSKRSEYETNHIEEAIKTSDAEFLSRYMCPPQGWTSWKHPRTGTAYTLTLRGTPQLSEAELKDCFGLIEQTSGEDYRTSSGGWHPAAKKREMRSPELRYVLVRTVAGAGANHNGEDGALGGFISMMPTFENGEPVVYVYEIHLRAEMQGSGLGRQLLSYAQSAASNMLGVGKVMLTCFTSNGGGMRFYERMGFVVDESSPRDRKLRGGKVVTSDYVILSWRAGAEREDADADGEGGEQDEVKVTDTE